VHKGKRHRVLKRDLLANQHAKVLDGEIFNGQVPKTMALPNQMRIVFRSTPVVILKLAQGARSIHAS
jgi:hypothetical protein